MTTCYHEHFKRLPDEGGDYEVCPYKDQGCECIPKRKPPTGVKKCLVCGKIIRWTLVFAQGK